MYPINDTILPSITPVRDLKNHESSVVIPTILVGMLILGAALALSKTEGIKGQKFEKYDTIVRKGQEPPELEAKIPFIGHLIGMLRWQVGYMQMLSCKCPSWPAFTLKIFSARVYVICDPSLIQAAYRNAKTFDFGSFVVESSEKLFNISQQGMKIIRGETAPGYDPNGPFLNGNRGKSFLNEDHRLMVNSLSPGTCLKDLTSKVLDGVAGSLNDIEDGDQVFGLYKWMRDTITESSADAIYGPMNPFSGNPELIDDLWHFERDVALLMLQFLPTFIAPKAYHARIAIKKAFASYYANGYDKQASGLIQSHLASCKKWGFSDDDIANFEVSTLFLATTNTVSTSFWQLSYILDDPALLAAIRSELLQTVHRQKFRRTNEERAILDTTLFQSHCPLLVSSFHETLRLVGAATSVRSVVEPATLASAATNTSFSLKSPAVIQLPSGITHSNPAIWGADADTFDPARFLPETKARLDKDTRRKQAQGFFPFGGGKHLCPGRHFATTEILSFVGAVILGFEVEGSRVPERAFQKLGTAVRKPAEDVQINMKRRSGWENVRWSFSLEGREKVDFGGLAGDSDEFSEE